MEVKASNVFSLCDYYSCQHPVTRANDVAKSRVKGQSPPCPQQAGTAN